MKSIDKAREELLKSIAPVGLETVGLASAHKRVLAQDFLAPIAFPLFATSSMDGFALLSADIENASEANPAELKIVGDIPAGTFTDQKVNSGSAMRIMTGAPLPGGADTVLPVELTNIQERGPDFPLPGKIKALRSLKPGKHVRPIGQDYEIGDRLLKKGSYLRAQEIALLAMNGVEKVSVYKKVRIAMFSSGDELQLPGDELGQGQIYESNSYSISALAKNLGAEIIQLPIAPDSLEAIISILDDAAHENPDMIISSAGVSVGSHDYVRDAIESNGSLDLWRVNMRPGKPFAFGQYRGIPLLALPANPVSSFVSFNVFANPAIQHMSGRNEIASLKIWGILKEDIRQNDRESLLRAIYYRKGDQIFVRLTGHQGSGNLFSLVQANCLVRVPAGKEAHKAGTKIEIWPF
jgi:molybdopterin molybdotransferase